jgi:carboxyl-terminal processing protease
MTTTKLFRHFRHFRRFTSALAAAALLVWLGPGLGASRAEAPAGGGTLSAEARAMLLADYYDDKLTGGALDLAAVQGMVTSLNGGKPDGPNAILDPRSMAELTDDLKGELVGIGAQIDYDETTGRALVMGTLRGSAAAAAGLQKGDRVLGVDGQPFRGRSLMEVMRAIRGKAGTSVRVSLLRGSAVVDKTMVRKRLALPSVEHLVAGDVALVTVRLFNERTPAELESALKAVSAGKAQRLLLDLRANAGGLFEKAIESAQLLVPKGAEIVRTVGRKGKLTRYHSKGSPVLGKLPLVILVDNLTASSAEVLAEALRVNNDATLVGGKTYGKWRMEMLRPLQGGYTLKFTVAMLQSPQGKNFDGKGLVPDVEVASGTEQLEHTRRIAELDKRLGADPQLKSALHVLKLRR